MRLCGVVVLVYFIFSYVNLSLPLIVVSNDFTGGMSVPMERLVRLALCLS
jgi:hypothetical protein